MVGHYLVYKEIVRGLSIDTSCYDAANIGMMGIASYSTVGLIPAFLLDVLLKSIRLFTFVVKQTYHLAPRSHAKLGCILSTELGYACSMVAIGLYHPMTSHILI